MYIAIPVFRLMMGDLLWGKLLWRQHVQERGDSMCLAVPGKILDRQDMLATIEIGGVTRKVSVMLLPEAKIGDFVLIHAGFAVQSIDEEEAAKTLALFNELEQYDEYDK